jgi:hypothetical protein
MLSQVSDMLMVNITKPVEKLTSQTVQPFQSFPPHWSQCFDLQPPPPFPGVLVGGLWVVVLVVVGLVVVVGGLGVVVGLVVVRVVVLIVVVLLVVGLGGSGGLGGLDPPFVGVSTWLPSQYTVGPSKARFFKMLLMRLVPGPVQRSDLAAVVFKGLGYSTWKTGLPSARKLL